MRNEHGDVIAALLIARDVTELAALQRRMGDLERHLAIGQMAAALAHDFNNILAAIGQSVYLLQNGGAKTEVERRNYIDIIQNAVRRGSEIIGRVREYLRTGSGAMGPVDLRQVLQEAVELTRPLWTKCKVQMHADLQCTPKVRANAADLRRVFTNLIINAMEAMPEGGEIHVTCHGQEGRVIATVTDSGPGIAPENRPKIFFPYFTTKQKGTGLGLSGAQKIILSQGGNISFRTELGKGTTFIVTMPVADEKRFAPQKHEEKKIPA
jgi:signal transduction histidine kinase